MREKQLKSWRRQKKVELIELENKDWKDLFAFLITLQPAGRTAISG